MGSQRRLVVVVLSALTPPQSQRFLRGHDGEICALAMFAPVPVCAPIRA